MQKLPNLFEKPKLRMILIIVCAVLLVAIVTVTVIGFRRDEPTPYVPDGDYVPVMAEPDETLPPEGETPDPTPAPTPTPAETKSTDRLLFESNGNGTATLVGLGTCTDSVLIIPSRSPSGDLITAIADRAFEGCTSLTEITLPPSIKEIGSGAFVGCTALKGFTVDQANTRLCAVGGVLMTRDKSTLLCYPAARTGTQYLLDTGISTIAAHAFANAGTLEAILYEGSAASFGQIRIEAGNETFTSLSVTCNYRVTGK